MNKKLVVLILVLIFVGLLIGTSILYTRLGQDLAPEQLATQPVVKPDVVTEEAAEEVTEPEPVMAPDFTVYDKEGNPIKLYDYTGKPLVVNFWASWCGPCKNEMPDFQALYEIYGEDVHFVMVNMTDGTRETQNTAATFIQESGYTFPVYFDLDSQADQTYQVYSLPTTYIIDRDGFLVARGMGTLSKEALQGGIDMVYP